MRDENNCTYSAKLDGKIFFAKLAVQRELFVAAIEANNDIYCLQKRKEKFPLNCGWVHYDAGIGPFILLKLLTLDSRWEDHNGLFSAL